MKKLELLKENCMYKLWLISYLESIEKLLNNPKIAKGYKFYFKEISKSIRELLEVENNKLSKEQIEERLDYLFKTEEESKK